MAGLLDGLNTDEARLGLGLLAAGGYSPTPMSFGQRVQMAMTGADAQKAGALKNKFLQSQVDENEAQIAERRRKVEEEKRIQGLLASAGASSAVSQGAFAPSADGMGPVMPQGAAPSPMIDYQALIRLGVPFERVKNLAESQNLGRQEIARTSEIEGPGGVKTLQGFDKYGGMVGQGVAGYVPPQLVNQGDRQSFVKPTAGVSLPVSMSPSERDASARGWAGHGLARQRLAFDQGGGVDGGGASQAAMIKQFGKPSAGYRWKEDGSQEFIPGGPADQKAQMQKSGEGTVGSVVADLRDKYNVLNDEGGIVSTQKGTLANLGARMGSTGVGQTFSGAVGTKTQSARESIAMTRPLLLQSIMKATGMSAKQMDSNAELKLYLATATDPTLGLEANMAALDRIETLYGGGSGSTQPPTNTKPKPANFKDAGYASESEAIKDAQNAIMRGAPRAAVQQRLKDMGLSMPAGAQGAW